MKDGQEFGSIVGRMPKNTANLVPEFRRALADIEAVRGRPCICYIANVISGGERTSIEAADHLPFAEMVALVPSAARAVDVMLVTPGGLGNQVPRFVDELRARFDEVDFLIPYKAMSAGTLWALSGDRIWMDSRAFLGPIDPQAQNRDGGFVPAQSLLAVLNMIQREFDLATQKQVPPPQAYALLLKFMDQKELGNAISASGYSITMAAEFLNAFKFRGWTTHNSTGAPVTPDERVQRALAAAKALCAHDRWKNHGHAITRDVIWQELRIKIEHPETVPGLERAIRRFWALNHWAMDKATVSKILLSQQYVFVRNAPPTVNFGGKHAGA
jgi:hypothetical protein